MQFVPVVSRNGGWQDYVGRCAGEFPSVPERPGAAVGRGRSDRISSLGHKPTFTDYRRCAVPRRHTLFVRSGSV